MEYGIRNGRKGLAALSFLLLLSVTHDAYAQRVAVKTNVAGWATASPNIESEFVLGRHVSLDVSVAANPVSTNRLKTTFTHVQPEVRYWVNRPMVSHFLGVTAFINNYNLLVGETRRKGDAVAAGLTYGYAWVLSDHWNMEATVGVGVMRYRQFKYAKEAPKPEAVNDSRTMVAPVKLGLSFAYVIR